MCTDNLNKKPARLILQVLKAENMIITNGNGIEWTVLYVKIRWRVCSSTIFFL